MNQPLPLLGCSPTPLAHYLKALGVLRLLSEQLPPGTPRPRGAWKGESFVIHATLDRAGLEKFFLHDYRPTPILAPWNGGSGFYFREEKLDEIDPETGSKRKTGIRNEETTATRTISLLLESTAKRLDSLRNGARFCRGYLHSRGLDARPSEDGKLELLRGIRGNAPDNLLGWFDASVVITNDALGTPPLLGSGGNDGNLDFSSTFIQHILRLFHSVTGTPTPDASELLANSLFQEPSNRLRAGKIGQFHPVAAGANNGGTGFSSLGTVNPWDYVLMLEGAVVFAAAAVRRMAVEPGSLASMPFTVMPTATGYNVACKADTKRPKTVKRGIFEMWLPLWQKPASLVELNHVFAEGRASVKGKPVRDGLSFSQAISTLGVDRGISAFQRYSFQPRNGDAFFATPLDRVPVRRHPRATELLDDLDHNNWLDHVRDRVRRDDRAPNGVASAVRQLEQAALALLRSSQQEVEEHAAVEALLLAVADTEAALARSLRWTKEKGLSPVRMLSAQWWENLRHGKDAELDLAAGLAALKQPLLRVHWEPLDLEKPFPVWNENSREVVWRDAAFVETLLAVHLRRIISADKNVSLPTSVYFVSPASIASFLDGQTDDQRLARLARALSLVQLPPDADRNRDHSSGESYEVSCAKLPALFALPRLALTGAAPDSEEVMPSLAAILRRGASGDGAAATRLAAQRLRGSGFTPALREVPARGASVRRAMAATLFPLSPKALDALADLIRPLKTQS